MDAKLIERIKIAQEILKSRFAPEYYNRVINQLLDDSDNNLGMLIIVVLDNKNSAELRLFALAAMGEYSWNRRGK